MARLGISETRFRTSVLAGVFLLALFMARYATIPSELYECRDDGVITMSHARNWIEYGVIGPNPSGGRLEGFSAPVQFFFCAVVYGLTRISYPSLALLQTVLFTVLLGGLFVRFFGHLGRGAWLVLSVAGLFLVDRASFFLWHGSGLENPITHLLVLATLYILFASIREGRIRWELSPVLAIATVSRLDSIYHVGPVLVVFAVAWWIAFRSLRGFLLAGLVIVACALVHLGRFLYFGDWLSNTAYAQILGFSDRVGLILDGNWNFLRYSLEYSRQILERHGAAVLLPFLPLLAFVGRRRETVFLLSACLTLVLTSFCNPIFLGKTTLDPTRTTTHLALVVALAGGTIVGSLWHRAGARWLLLVAGLAATFIHLSTRQEPYGLCCATDEFESYRQEFVKVEETEELPRPTVANPDLGAMTWCKQFNVIDIGALGNPFFSRLRHGPLLSDYFFDFVAPDMIETHEAWSCLHYEAIFGDERFARLYEPVRATYVDWNRCQYPDLPVGIWVRRDIKRGAESAERRLIDSLTESRSLERISEEFAACSQSGRETAYIARTAYRFLPEFAASGNLNALRELVSSEGGTEFDRFLVARGAEARAYEGVARALAERFLDRHLGAGSARVEPDIRSDFDVYVTDREVILLREPCSKGDLRGRLIFAVRGPAESGGERTVMDRDFREVGYLIGDMALAVLEIPPGGIRSLIVGVRYDAERFWRVRYDFPPETEPGAPAEEG